MVLYPDSRAGFELLPAMLTEPVRNGSVGGAGSCWGFVVALPGLRNLILPPLKPALYGMEANGKRDSEMERHSEMEGAAPDLHKDCTTMTEDQMVLYMKYKSTKVHRGA